MSVIALFVLSAVAVGTSQAAAIPDFKSKATQTRTDAWIVDMQDNFDNPQWFFDNLNDEDRKKIRQALDWAIPRQEIIDSILGGHGFLLESTVVPQSGVYYDDTVVPRDFNQSKAIELLVDVFGYNFADFTDDDATPYDESLPYFRLTMTVPSTNPLRSQWAARISYSYLAIGVDIVYKQWTWNTIGDKIFDNPGYLNSYDNGGFDAQFIGWSGGVLPGDRFFFHSDSLPPNGGNYQGLTTPAIDAMIEEQETTQNLTRRIELYHQQQADFFDDVWRNILFQNEAIWAYDRELQGFNPYFGASIPYQNITFTSGNEQSTLVVSRAGEFQHFNPFISNSFYDNFVLGNLHLGLVGTSTLSGSTDLYTFETFPIYAEWYNTSTDELTWFFNMHDDLVWENGDSLNTSDVVFSFDAMLNGAFPASAGYRSQLKNSTTGAITAHNSTLIEFNLHRWDPFTNASAFFGLPILPESQLGGVALDQWSSDDTDSNSTLWSNGPYTFTNVENNVAQLQNSTTWTPAYYTKFSHIPYMNYPVISNVTVVLNNQADVALTALKNGEIDIIDYNTGLASIFDQINGTTSTYQLYSGSVWQEMGLNQGSPIWGINPQAPPVTTTTTTAVDTTTTDGGDTTTTDGGSAPFGDVVTIAAAFVTVAAISFTLRRRRN